MDPCQLFPPPYQGAAPFTDTRGRVRVDPALRAEATCILVTDGQSNAGNHSDVDTLYLPRNPGIHNLNIYDGGVYEAKDPLLGCSGTQGNVAIRFADLLIDAGLYTRVILAPMAIGALGFVYWAPWGPVRHRIPAMAARLRAHNYPPTFILRVHGETDALMGYSTVQSTAWLASIIAAYREAGMTCPIFNALSTFSSSAGLTPDMMNATRVAILSQTDDVSVFTGPDTDTLRVGYRDGIDGTHFNAAGLNAHAAMWRDVIADYLAG